jgi:putative phosphoribosyl transferase
MLADKLEYFAGRSGVVVLGLPRGGVPVAYEVARRLGVPLDVFLVRKLGVPGHEELAMGAIATGGTCIVNTEVVQTLGISQLTIDAAVARERIELERREAAYRGGPPIELCDREVILVDDGLATGATMRAAVLAVHDHHPKEVIVAVPVADSGIVEEFKREVAKTVCVLTPDNLEGVGQWYEDFTQTSDEEVRALLALAKATMTAHAPVSRPSG